MITLFWNPIDQFNHCDIFSAQLGPKSIALYRLCGLVVRHSHQRSGDEGSILGRVKPRALKLVLAADPPSVWHYGFNCLGQSALCQDNVTGCGACKRSVHHSVAARFQLSQAPSLT
ncbi:hypothetical protein ElyMa_003973100 [Elysia marginata]|uniref:Uncharacterized protein n=1 Tax=Elysia marginata TaxID=1093978 RepID=A0AAV4FW90_9GAST|nr:hypothetical protein ElyMa_003973100 [Elysia marginata]